MRQGSLISWLSKTSTCPQAAVEQVDHETKSFKDVSSPDTINESVQRLKETPIVQPATTALEMRRAATDVPSNVELRACTKQDISSVKQLLALLLPIPYPEKFFKEIVEDQVTNDLTILAFWHDNRTARADITSRLVGVIRCRLLANTAANTNSTARDSVPPLLYLSALALLSPYRGHGIAAHLLRTVEQRAFDEYGASTVGAHVWKMNTEGLEWYRKRGFREARREEGYYRRLNPQTALVLQREIEGTGVYDD